jgi:hypothetical protein
LPPEKQIDFSVLQLEVELVRDLLPVVVLWAVKGFGFGVPNAFEYP